MTLQNVLNWLKSVTDTGEGIYTKTINGNQERCIGIYDARGAVSQRVCLGGAVNTKYNQKNIRIFVHWTKDAQEAEKKAKEIYHLLYARSNIVMDGVRVYSLDPGAAPAPIGRDHGGVYEYMIEISLQHERE